MTLSSSSVPPFGPLGWFLPGKTKVGKDVVVAFAWVRASRQSLFPLSGDRQRSSVRRHPPPKGDGPCPGRCSPHRVGANPTPPSSRRRCGRTTASGLALRCYASHAFSNSAGGTPFLSSMVTGLTPTVLETRLHDAGRPIGTRFDWPRVVAMPEGAYVLDVAENVRLDNL